MNLQDVKKYGGVYLFYRTLPIVIVAWLFTILSSVFYPQVWGNTSSDMFFTGLKLLAVVLPITLLSYPAGKHFRWCQDRFLKNEIEKCQKELSTKKFSYEKNAAKERGEILFRLLTELRFKEKKDARRYLFVVGIITYYIAIVLIFF